jgi:uncharacterized protein (DUF2252 family)
MLSCSCVEPITVGRKCVPDVCKILANAPPVVSTGDLHLESFGTSCDGDGRLCWGVDDFDESCPLPYTNDLVRLAVTAKIAADLDLLKIRAKHACKVILDAYEQTLCDGGDPIVLAEQERHMERLGIDALKAPECFWEKPNKHPTIRHGLSRDLKQAFEKALPDIKLAYRIIQRQAGMGSLGQQRFVAIAEFSGGCIAREAKRVVPSASVWLAGRVARRQPYYETAMRPAVRSHDPCQMISGSWLIRRLPPTRIPSRLMRCPRNAMTKNCFMPWGPKRRTYT